ncbi:1007_t:CDS:2, partial [Acaulospora colombiana]
VVILKRVEYNLHPAEFGPFRWSGVLKGVNIRVFEPPAGSQQWTPPLSTIMTVQRTDSPSSTEIVSDVPYCSTSIKNHPLTDVQTMSTRVDAIEIADPVLNLYNSKGQLSRKKNMQIWNSHDPGYFKDNSTPNVAGSIWPVTIDVSKSTQLV